MESTGDKARAIVYSLLLHGAIALFILGGLWWTRETRQVVMPGPIIEASLVGPTSAPKPSSRATRPKPATPPPVDAPEPEPPKPEPPEPEPKPEPPKPEPEQAPSPAPPKPDLVDQQKVAALAEQKADDARKEQEAKVRQRQIDLDLEQKAEAERAKKLAEVKKEREAASKKLAVEKAKLEQIQDLKAAQRKKAERDRMNELLEQEAPQAQTGAGGKDDDLTARYAAAIQAQAVSNWRRPEGINSVVCDIRILQIPGGDVISASVSSSCAADELTRTSMEAAVRQQALPYQGYEKVFRREIVLTFCYPLEVCPK